jgi:nitrite reductase/ring-hydroxylating ferredoxin subunit
MSAAAPGSHPPGKVLPAPSLKALRATHSYGFSRRTLIRRALGAGLGLLAIEWLGGSLAFAWSAGVSAPPRVRVGTLDDLVLTNPGLPVREGFPIYLAAARAFIVVLDPGIGRFETGSDATGDGAALNVRALSQICPHLGCRPNPCIEDYWFRCPCHQSRYDRLGTKAEGELFGPAPRGMDRFALEVDADGVLTIDTAVVTLGPLPVALGDPGIIPPRVEGGCM